MITITHHEPEIGELYTTHRSQVVGFVVEKVPNKSGSIRLRLLTAELTTRWTTFVPAAPEVVA